MKTGCRAEQQATITPALCLPLVPRTFLFQSSQQGGTCIASQFHIPTIPFPHCSHALTLQFLLQPNSCPLSFSEHWAVSQSDLKESAQQLENIVISITECQKEEPFPHLIFKKSHTILTPSPTKELLLELQELEKVSRFNWFLHVESEVSEVMLHKHSTARKNRALGKSSLSTEEEFIGILDLTCHLIFTHNFQRSLLESQALQQYVFQALQCLKYTVLLL